MRDIKCRIWCKQTDEMQTVEHMGFDEGELWYVEDEDREIYFMDRNDSVLMQYTGLKDKNGREIYEGDIVKYRFDVNPNTKSGAKERISEIFWNEFRGSWAVCSNGSSKSLNNDLFHYVQNGNTVEVIGNIYEHKKLLATT